MRRSKRDERMLVGYSQDTSMFMNQSGILTKLKVFDETYPNLLGTCSHLPSLSLKPSHSLLTPL